MAARKKEMKNTKPFPPFPLRTRFAKDIVCEFLPPARSGRRSGRGLTSATPAKVLILATGMPGYPGGRGKALQEFSQKGFWVFVPRYRGTWESGGKFLTKSPHEDVLEVAKGVSKSFTDFYSGKKMRIRKPEVYVIGASFGGAAAVLASTSPLIKKAVAFSPVIDWTKQYATEEPLSYMKVFIPRAFGEAYRGNHKTIWKKLESGKFFNPASEAKKIKGKKLLIIHAKDDGVVPFAPAKEFAEKTSARFVPLRRGGHFGTSSALKPHLWKRTDKFFKAK